MEIHDFDFEAMAGMRSISFDEDSLMEFLGAGELSSVLDLGAGDGFFAKMFANRGAQVTAVDINDKYFAEMNGLGIATEKEDICKFRKGMYDMVFMANVLHDLECKEIAASNISIMSKRYFAAIEFKNDTPFGPPKYIRISPDEVSELFKTAGFKLARQKELKYHYVMLFRKA
ncbi:Methyltransferase type 11 [mine drainage metagenome]|uniref:Methyltransferase type 11 n=1 Tax=mine drainage metagenome TaxID=410659 RepID=T1AM86_9ZZZZ